MHFLASCPDKISRLKRSRNRWLTLLWQQKPQPNVFCSCGSELHNGQEGFWTVSVQQYSWDVWCELLSWASQSGWGQDSDCATSEGVFSSVEAILLLIYFCVLGRCPVASPNFCWWSYDKMIASCPGPKAAMQPQTMMLPPPYFTVGMSFCCPFLFST